MRQRLQFALWHLTARLAAGSRRSGCRPTPALPSARPAPQGISVVIPSRNGRHLLAAQLPEILHQSPREVIPSPDVPHLLAAQLQETVRQSPQEAIPSPDVPHLLAAQFPEALGQSPQEAIPSPDVPHLLAAQLQETVRQSPQETIPSPDVPHLLAAQFPEALSQSPLEVIPSPDVPHLLAAQLQETVRQSPQETIPSPDVPHLLAAQFPEALGQSPQEAIPSPDVPHLLAAQFPEALGQSPLEVIVVDNGSTDGTAAWLAAAFPSVLVDVSPVPLSFAAAVNRGIVRARYSHVCLLNNDMLLDPGFFLALRRAFDLVPNLFCATAQIRFPAGVRREETGKAVMAQSHPDDFPLRCDDPLPGEDLTWVLYGSGGCSLYDAARLRALGGIDEAYAPAYVEDLDIGYRAWKCGWPSVYVAGAMVEHRHRATTSRYYTETELAEVLEKNYLRFLARAVAAGPLFRELWRQAIDRLRRRRDPALRHAAAILRESPLPEASLVPEPEFLALTSGDVAAFPGNGAAPALVGFAAQWTAPSDALLARHCEVIIVRDGKEDALRAATAWSEKKQAGGTTTSHPACAID